MIYNHFKFQDGIEVVYGATRAAIHDFRRGVLYSVNSAGASLLRRLEAGQGLATLEPAASRFVARLNEAGLVAPAGAPPLPAVGQAQAFGQHHPLEFVWLELNAHCNLACSHCYAETQNPALRIVAPPVSADQPLRMAEWESILQQIAETGCKRIQFIGGEALLDRRLLALIDVAQGVGISSIELFTNGVPLSQQRAHALAEHGVYVAASLHGATPEVHDAITRVPGSFARTVGNVRRLVELGVPVRIAAIAQRDNQHDISDVSALGDELGVYDVFVDVIRPIGSGQDASLAPELPDVLGVSYLTEPRFMANRDVFDHNHHWNACWAGRLTITSTGDVIPCAMGRGELIGNVRREPLQQILRSPRLMALWGITKDQVEVCCDCEYRYVCGDCRPLALASGNLHGSMSRCTYDPRRGDWGQPGSGERMSGLADESMEATMTPVAPYSATNGDKQPSNLLELSLSPVASSELRSRANFFNCPPSGTNGGRQPVIVPSDT